MANRIPPDSEPSANTADKPFVKTQSGAWAHDCESELQHLEESLSKLRLAVSHRVESGQEEHSKLQRELKDASTLANSLRARLEQQEAANRELTQLLSDERTANVRLCREHDKAMEALGSELNAARLILGDALGEPAAPRNSLVVRKQEHDADERQKQAADTVRPKAGSGR